MAQVFLSVEDVIRLTGSTHAKKQIEYLKDRGIPFICDVKGRPVPHKHYIDQIYGIKKIASIEPDFGALNE